MLSVHSVSAWDLRGNLRKRHDVLPTFKDVLLRSQAPKMNRDIWHPGPERGG
jgi:hypothetical protein